jgi:hypothetical protein
MADTQSILQLGIEAARAGNKAEARELFRLVTREDPNNAQGWLWLAGVAEDREEKRVALERVVQLEPSNQLAQKGLAGLGGPRTAPVNDLRDTGVTTPMPTDFRPDTSHARPPVPSGPASDQDIADAFDSIDSYATAPESTRARTYDQAGPGGGYIPPDFGDEDYDLSEYQNRPRVTADDIAARENDRTVVVQDEEPRRRGIMAWLPLVLLLLLLCAGGAYAFNTFRNRGGGAVVNDPNTGISGTTTANQTGTADTNLGNTPPLTTTTVAGEPGGASPAPVGGEQPGGASPAPVGGEQPGGASPVPVGGEQPGGASPAPVGGEQPGGASPAPVGGEQPGGASPAPVGGQPAVSPAPVGGQPAASPAAPAPDVAGANPAIVPNGQVLRAGNFEYSFSGIRNVATGSYGGARAARGQYEIVLITVRNVGGNPQQIPDGFFVVKDAQGRVSDFNRAASIDYINRFGGTGPGGAGDYAADAQLQPGGFLGSMPLLFDVATDATDVVLFSRDNPGQGFRIR